MNSCHSSLEAMKFKGLPFHSVLGLKYKEKREEVGRRRWEEIETTDGAQRRKVGCGWSEAREPEAFTVHLNF